MALLICSICTALALIAVSAPVLYCHCGSWSSVTQLALEHHALAMYHHGMAINAARCFLCGKLASFVLSLETPACICRAVLNSLLRLVCAATKLPQCDSMRFCFLQVDSKYIAEDLIHDFDAGLEYAQAECIVDVQNRGDSRQYLIK